MIDKIKCHDIIRNKCCVTIVSYSMFLGILKLISSKDYQRLATFGRENRFIVTVQPQCHLVRNSSYANTYYFFI